MSNAILELKKRVRLAKTSDDVDLILTDEMAKIRDERNTLASVKARATQYRTALLDDPMIAKRKRERIKTILKLDKDETSELNKGYRLSVKAETRNRRHLEQVDTYLAKLESLLTAKSYLDRIIGIAGLTGRRLYEVGCTAHFEKVDDHHVLFSGQAKTKNRGDVPAYKIPVLQVSSNVIIKALHQLRQDKPDLINVDGATFHNRVSKEASKRIKKHFGDLFDTPKAKDLRSIYVRIAHHQFADKATGFTVFASDVLGHREDDVETGVSYDDFYIGDQTSSKKAK